LRPVRGKIGRSCKQEKSIDARETPITTTADRGAHTSFWEPAQRSQQSLKQGKKNNSLHSKTKRVGSIRQKERGKEKERRTPPKATTRKGEISVKEIHWGKRET